MDYITKGIRKLPKRNWGIRSAHVLLQRKVSGGPICFLVGFDGEPLHISQKVAEILIARGFPYGD